MSEANRLQVRGCIVRHELQILTIYATYSLFVQLKCARAYPSVRWAYRFPFDLPEIH